MSDLLSGLDTFDVYASDDLYGNGQGGMYVRKDDVREVLRNPTDEQVNAIIKATERTGKMTASQVRAVLAAAGGDR